MITAGDGIEVVVSVNGEDIIDVVGQLCQAFQEEEGLAVSALGRADLGDPLEAASDGLNEWRVSGGEGNGEEVYEVISGLMSP